MDMGAEGGPAQLSGTEIRQRIADMTRSRIAEDLDRLLGHFAADTTIHYKSAEKGPFTRGTLHGLNAYREKLRRIGEVYRGVDCEILGIVVEADQAWVRWRSRWRHVGRNTLIPIYMANFLRWRDGKVVEMHEFLDVAIPSIVGHSGVADFDALLHPAPAGASREEMIGRARKVADAHAAPMANDAVFRQYYAPNVVCDFVGEPSRIHYAGKRVGVDALIGINRTIDVEFEQLGHELSEIVVEGSWLACRRSLEWRHRGTGRQGFVELAEFVKFENGRIVEMIEFRDPATVQHMQGDYGDRRVIY